MHLGCTRKITGPLLSPHSHHTLRLGCCQGYAPPLSPLSLPLHLDRGNTYLWYITWCIYRRTQHASDIVYPIPIWVAQSAWCLYVQHMLIDVKQHQINFAMCEIWHTVLASGIRALSSGVKICYTKLRDEAEVWYWHVTTLQGGVP